MYVSIFKSYRKLILQSCLPWITLTTPSGNPASLVSSINIMQAPGSRSDGFIKQVFPVTRAMGNIYRYKISTQLIGYSHNCEPISRSKHLVLKYNVGSFLTHNGIIAGKLNGVMPAVTPRGTRKVIVSISLAIPGRVSPSWREVILQQCSTTSVIHQ